MKQQKATYQSEHPFHSEWKCVSHGPDYGTLPRNLLAVYACHLDHDHNAMTHCLPSLKHMGVGAETMHTNEKAV